MTVNISKETYIKNYCREKTLGNGFYDFSVTVTNWQTAYAWEEVLGSDFEPREDLDNKLDYYCDLVEAESARRYQQKLDNLLLISIESLPFNAKETEFLNEMYAKWFHTNKFEIFGDVLPLPTSKTVRRQERWNPMNKSIIDAVRKNYESHTGKGFPTYILCLDARDAKGYSETKYIITFRDAYKTGITKLTGKILLSDKSSEVLYGNNL